MGKSWLLLRWVGEGNKLQKNAASISTIGIDFKMKVLDIDGERIKIQVVSYLNYCMIYFEKVFCINSSDYCIAVGYGRTRKI